MRDLIQASTPRSKRPAAGAVFWLAAVGAVALLLLQPDERPARPALAAPADNPPSAAEAATPGLGCGPGCTASDKELNPMSAIPNPSPQIGNAGPAPRPARVETATFAMG